MDVIARSDADEPLDDWDLERLAWLGDWRPDDAHLDTVASRLARWS